MKIYHVHQEENHDYDTFSDFVVITDSAEKAKHTNPEDSFFGNKPIGSWDGKDDGYSAWTSIENVEVICIGIAIEGETERIVSASYHAG